MKYNESALPIDTILLKDYKIENILGAGSFGITYLANDIKLEKKVVIKEFFPNEISIRKKFITVVPKTLLDKDNFQWGMSRFLLEAQTLAKFNHPNIVKINRFFNANGTAYFVMEYEEGEDLEEYLIRHKNQLNEEEIYNIIMPILDGLKEVHSRDFLHRDIKPSNIFIRRNSSPMLIDFGASRFAIGARSQSLSIILTEGYAPKEQYSSTSKQEAYSDIYSIGAVIYKMVTSTVPIEASERSNKITDDEPDPYQKLQNNINIPYSNNFKKTIDWALKFKGKDRPQNVKEFQDMLISNFQTEENDVPKIIDNSKNKYYLIIVIFISISILIAILYNKVKFLEQEIHSNTKVQIEYPQRQQETKRLQAEQEIKHLQAEQEMKHLQAEQETKRLQAEQETKRLQAEQETKRLQAEQETKRLQEEIIENFMQKYYSNFNKHKYNENYQRLSYQFQSKISYNAYSSWFLNDVEYLKLHKIYFINSLNNEKAIVDLKIHYLRKDGKFKCSTNRLNLIYNNQWIIDKISSKNCKDGILEYENNNIKLKMNIPLFMVKNKKAIITISMLNKTAYTTGGLTVSFPQFSNLQIYDRGSTFSFSKGYIGNNKVWNTQQEKKVLSKYYIYEGWTRKFKDNEKRLLNFHLFPDKIENLNIFIRSLMTQNNSEYRNPTNGIIGQQGYPNIKFNIPVINN